MHYLKKMYNFQLLKMQRYQKIILLCLKYTVKFFLPSGISQESDADYLPHGMSRYRRQIPRTLVMERVRSAIEERRVRRTQNMRRLLSSDEVCFVIANNEL